LACSALAAALNLNALVTHFEQDNKSITDEITYWNAGSSIEYNPKEGFTYSTLYAF